MSAIPGVTTSYSTVEDVESSPVPTVPKEIVKQEITIKEITPVSEIPVITEVKIKEILPSPSIEVAEYSSSKSPLIVREATTEKTIVVDPETKSKTEAPIIVEFHPSSPASSIEPEAPTKLSESSTETKSTNDSPPSKISLSTQDSINSDIYPSAISSLATMGSPSIIHEVVHVASTTKAPIIEEEDPSLFEHNPAFPPIPDDLSQINNHEEEIVSEQNVDVEHVSIVHEVIVPSVPSSTETLIVSESLTTTPQPIVDTTSASTTTTTDKVTETSTVITTTESSISEVQSTLSTEKSVKESPMLNLRSAIPTEILNIPSSVPEDITGELDDLAETTILTTEATPVTFLSTSTENVSVEKISTEKLDQPGEVKTDPTSIVFVTEVETITTPKAIDTIVYISSTPVPQQETTSSIAKSDVATEITTQTELSSLPIETSDQNPHETSEIITKEQITSSTADPTVKDLETTKISMPVETEIITVSRAASTENQSFENIETTEFVLTSFGSSESATDAVELIKISAEPEKSAALIESPAPQGKKNNVLTELINLVDDVASISDHTEAPDFARSTTSHISISDSEELIPYNAGYKSKNSNWNLNSITEIPLKSKNPVPINKQKVVEIEDEESESITDSPPPNDKVEPTTRRPIIDNVSDDMPQNRTEKKDIEIITKSYVPTINRRPTKVVMKKSNEPVSEEATVTDRNLVSTSSEMGTESSMALSSEVATVAPEDEEPEPAAPDAAESIAEAAPALDASVAQ